MRKIYYLGSFPPPYGGVTVKNELLYEILKDKFDICVMRKFTAVSMVGAFLKGKKFLLGVGHTKYLLMLSNMMYYLRPKAMRKSIVFAMGGNLADLVEGKPETIKRLQRYRQIYVEPTGMMARLQKMGLKNLSLLPNCRVRPAMELKARFNKDGIIKCVFFSRVSRDKGTDTVLDVAKRLPNVEFHLYGGIDSDYHEVFMKDLGGLPNATYHGVFMGRDEEVYREMSKYDVMLLPTRWKFEGVPGVLVESKIAGIPAIVSDILYNSEIVEDGVSGIVLKENTAEYLTEAIERLEKNREELYGLKNGAKLSAERYYIDNYIENIEKDMEDGKESYDKERN